ncbi:MAG: DUF6179 domain-containing protein [Oscillospiraceae bacterium]
MNENMLIPFENPFLTSADLSEGDLSLLQLKLWQLLSRRTALYTGGDSSSVPVETAGELLSSICFLLQLYQKESGASLTELAHSDAEESFTLALRNVEAAIENGKQLYKAAFALVPEVKSMTLDDTIRALGVFFKKYDYRYLAHQIPCDINYSLCLPVPQALQGVEYVNEYLRRLIIENQLVRSFHKEEVSRLLSVYCPDYMELLVNIFEPVFTNALGLALLGHQALSLNISADEQRELAAQLSPLSPAARNSALTDAASALAQQLNLSAPAKAYLLQAAQSLSPRIAAAQTAGSLDGIFLSW